MSKGTRWPDFRLASTLWSLVGTGPKPETTAEEAPAPAPADADVDADASTTTPQLPQERDDEGDGGRQPGSSQQDQHFGSSIFTMTDAEGRPIDGLGGFEPYDAESQGGGMEADFGSLELFDSTAAEAPFSSQVNETFSTQAPPAVMSTDDPPASEAKKSKRSKKDKKKKRGEAESSVEPHEEGNHKRAKRKSTLESTPADATETAQPTDDASQPPDEAASSTQTKRKRRTSDNAEGKRRKKRRSHDLTPETTEAHATTFLHKDTDPGAGAAAAIVEEDAADSELQQSPTVAHLRRRSQSHEARSREQSTAREQVEAADKDHDAIAALDVENLAREAWNEHLNGRSGAAANEEDQGTADVEMPDADKPAEEATEEPSTTPRPKRSARLKKAKPTYFEQPQEDQNAANELPSPSAMTPKPRKRAKAATRKTKTAPRPKMSQSMQGASDDDDIDAPKGRRNRMAGYTQGRFTDEELERISKAVKEYAEENDLTQQQVNEMIHAAGGTSAGEAHAQLWSRLFAECPDRHRQKVINITRKKFHNFVARGTWTAEQDAELRRLIEVNGTKWSKIAGLINRHPEDLRDRYRNYIVCGDSQRKEAWDEEEETRLAQYVIESMKHIDDLRAMHPNRKLFRKPYEELIDWQNISERMDRTRSRLQCITKWKSLNLKFHGKDQLASLQPDSQISFQLEKARRQIEDMPEEERFRLILAIKDSQAGTESKIPWYKIVDKQFRNDWHRATQVLLWHRLKKTVPDWERKSVRDCAQYLIDEYNRTAEIPGVDGDGFNDMEEMQIVQSSTVTSSSAKKAERAKKERQSISQDYVVDSDADADAEDGDAAEGNEAAENGAAPEDDGMQIDPALIGETQPEPEEAQAAEPTADPEWATNPGSTKKTPSKKATYGKKRSSAKKGPMLTQDPIEDVATQEPTAEKADGSDLEEEQLRKKKTPGKFKTSRSKKRQASPAAPTVSSDMDDMEDLPARVET